MKLRFTKRAVRQIEDIIEGIALESPMGARRLRERMQSITTLLIEHPHIGQQTDLAGVRRMLVSPYPYLIFYRVTEDAVIVQRVRHAARDPSGAPQRA
ncbi:MAG: toxin ParE1/3/4 [Bradyrhizobium sp.]|nr:toxin ParE1/3/4 [Bradyrhizobium sp.]